MFIGVYVRRNTHYFFGKRGHRVEIGLFGDVRPVAAYKPSEVIVNALTDRVIVDTGIESRVRNDDIYLIMRHEAVRKNALHVRAEILNVEIERNARVGVIRVFHRFFNDFFFRAFNHAVFGRTAAINNYFLARGASCGIVFRPARSRIAFDRLRTAFADGSVCLSARRETYRHDHRRDCAKDFFECFHLFLSLFVFIVFGFFAFT